MYSLGIIPENKGNDDEFPFQVGSNRAEIFRGLYGVGVGIIQGIVPVGFEFFQVNHLDNTKARRDAGRSGKDLQVITSQGKKAAAFVKSLVGKGSVLEIEFDVERRDRYGRLLAYLYFPDGRMLNEEIVRAGYASVMTIPPNGKYKDRFLKAYREARESRVGLWGE
ncbi:MAG: hypothetical protein CVV44_17255 [Spirochaetae bacterium HGW-Spirochaetae-1]|nr:MAG: hypothetical protein CVV44_17255 [Spirochaetae bacterium HGW-Spirochaetae-1]